MCGAGVYGTGFQLVACIREQRDVLTYLFSIVTVSVVWSPKSETMARMLAFAAAMAFLSPLTVTVVFSSEVLSMSICAPDSSLIALMEAPALPRMRATAVVGTVKVTDWLV